MNSYAYYNEIDPFCCAWLRQLIKAGLIADGYVDERSILEVKPEDLDEFTQCHFFAGIGVWSYALRQSGWNDDRAVWSASCPCQPFSTAGKQKGFKDERHLWPVLFNLIQECQPVTVFGEQVAGKNGTIWLDAVQDDLEGESYTTGACVTAACGFGAPHQRKRLYWVTENELADTNQEQHQESLRVTGSNAEENRRQEATESTGLRTSNNLADTTGGRRVSGSSGGGTEREGGEDLQAGSEIRSQSCDSSELCQSSELANTNLYEHQHTVTGVNGEENGDEVKNRENLTSPRQSSGTSNDVHTFRSNATNGFWGTADWIYCRDDKWRAVEPTPLEVVDGTATRMVSGSYSRFPLCEKGSEEAKERTNRLKGYGNSIVAQQAQAFIESYIETCLERGVTQMTEADAVEFDNANPQIWEEFIVCASKLIKAGREYYSARSIMHVLRWHSAVSGEGEYKVNHNMSPYYARKWAKLFPKYEEFFRIRKSQLDMEGETDVGEDLVGATTGDSDLVQSREVSGERIESGSYQSSFNFGG